MKRLYLIRHAKSSWKDPGLSDHDRPFNSRGERDAPLMAKLLKRNEIYPDLIISSTAARANEFAKIIAEELGYKKKDILSTKNLYMADEREMLQILREVKDRSKIVFMIGHNPDLTNFANTLSKHNIDNIPTSGIFAIEFDIDSWIDVNPGKGKFVSFDYPKKYFY